MRWVAWHGRHPNTNCESVQAKGCITLDEGEHQLLEACAGRVVEGRAPSSEAYCCASWEEEVGEALCRAEDDDQGEEAVHCYYCSDCSSCTPRSQQIELSTAGAQKLLNVNYAAKEVSTFNL